MSVASLGVLFVAIQQAGSDVRAAGIGLGFWFPALVTVLGGLVAFRQPQNRIAWLLMGVGLAVLIEMYLQLFLSVEPITATWVHGVAVVLVHAALPIALYLAFLIPWMFPDGHFYARWQRIAVIPTAAVIAAMPLIALITVEIGQPYPAEGEAWVVDNPIGFLPAPALDAAIAVGIVVLLFTAVSGVFSLARRYRNSSVIVRAQIRWIAWSISIVALVLVVLLTTNASQTSIGGLLVVVSFTTMPVSMTVAITRYRLFEIDRIISRTLTYTAIVVVLGAAFFGLVAATTALLPAQNSLAVASSTLAVAALFNPLRKRVQGAVDRRFNRSAHENRVVTDRFTGALRKSMTLEEISHLWTDTVASHFQPAAASVWIADRDTAAEQTD